MFNPSPTLSPIVLFIAVAIVINNIFKYRLHRRFIDSGLLNESMMKSLLGGPSLKNDALKWGLLLFSGGLGFILIEFLPIQTDHSTLPFGIEAIFIAIGFLVYYNIIKRDER